MHRTGARPCRKQRTRVPARTAGTPSRGGRTTVPRFAGRPGGRPPGTDTSPYDTPQSRPWSRRPRHGLDAPADWRFLDRPAAPLARAIDGLPLGPYRDLPHGVWLGHPLHPALGRLPIGCWISAELLDTLPGNGRTAGVPIAAGPATAGPAAVAGCADRARLDPPRRRTGLVHAAANTTGVLLFAASLSARCRRRRLRGRLVGLAGPAAVMTGGVLGGRLSYRQAAGPDRAADADLSAPPDWTGVGPVEDFPVGEPVRRTVDGPAAVVVRGGEDDWHVLAERCTHLSGPLSEGTVVDGCLRCPWHGSEFRLRDGEAVRGPATAPQPVLRARVLSGHLELRRPGTA
ncbi:Rieske 2Fe-2S domain-containing protein [Kitasatospora sp. NPDC056327]|uniref:Rieske 2Fe-2S domain-containing protein n=1 Tax=Kitasatospora sp. NPDC056327 TaxID=3345785 RepID=UPI0035DCB24E